MTKIKITLENVHQNSNFLKITLNGTQDHLFGCHKHEQIDWFCSVVWAKLNSLKAQCDLNQELINGRMEGKIIRKSQFLGQWEFRTVKID